MIRWVAMLLLLPGMAGCSQRELYHAVQDAQRLECQKYPDARYDTCMEALDTPYDAYARELAASDGTGDGTRDER